MADQPNETTDDAGLTKPKKQRSEAQKAATERMRAALETKHGTTAEGVAKMTPEEKKLRLKVLKEQLNGPSKKDKVAPVKAAPAPEPVSESESEEVAPPPKKKEPKIVSQPVIKKKEPKIIYETESESEEEVIVVKKKKKPKKKTIIYEDATDSEEEEPVKPVRKERETKTQQNASSKFKVTPGSSDKPKAPTGPIYYFAD